MTIPTESEKTVDQPAFSQAEIERQAEAMVAAALRERNEAQADALELRRALGALIEWARTVEPLNPLAEILDAQEALDRNWGRTGERVSITTMDGK